jgi:hypothetical protein
VLAGFDINRDLDDAREWRLIARAAVVRRVAA